MATSKRAEIEKRVLEAEKVVVSNILHNWKRRYGMDYLIVVCNDWEKEDVFSRYEIADEHLGVMHEVVAQLEGKLDKLLTRDVLTTLGATEQDIKKLGL